MRTRPIAPRSKAPADLANYVATTQPPSESAVNANSTSWGVTGSSPVPPLEIPAHCVFLVPRSATIRAGWQQSDGRLGHGVGGWAALSERARTLTAWFGFGNRLSGDPKIRVIGGQSPS